MGSHRLVDTVESVPVTLSSLQRGPGEVEKLSLPNASPLSGEAAMAAAPPKEREASSHLQMDRYSSEPRNPPPPTAAESWAKSSPGVRTVHLKEIDQGQNCRASFPFPSCPLKLAFLSCHKAGQERETFTLKHRGGEVNVINITHSTSSCREYLVPAAPGP